MILYTISHNIFVIKIFNKRLTWRWAIIYILLPHLARRVWRHQMYWKSLASPNVVEIYLWKKQLVLKSTCWSSRYEQSFGEAQDLKKKNYKWAYGIMAHPPTPEFHFLIVFAGNSNYGEGYIEKVVIQKCQWTIHSGYIFGTFRLHIGCNMATFCRHVSYIL